MNRAVLAPRDNDLALVGPRAITRSSTRPHAQGQALPATLRPHRPHRQRPQRRPHPSPMVHHHGPGDPVEHSPGSPRIREPRIPYIPPVQPHPEPPHVRRPRRPEILGERVQDTAVRIGARGDGHPAGAQDRSLPAPAAVDGPVCRGETRRGRLDTQRVETHGESPAEDDGDAQALVVQAERSATPADLAPDEFRNRGQLLAPGRRLEDDEEPLEERAVQRCGQRGRRGTPAYPRTRRQLPFGQAEMGREIRAPPDPARLRPQGPPEQTAVSRRHHGRVRG